MDNAGGWAGVILPSTGLSPAEALMQSSKMNDVKAERMQSIMLQQQRRMDEDRLKNYEYLHSLGHDWKPLGDQVDAVAHQKIQQYLDKYSNSNLLNSDPAAFRMALDQDTKNLVNWHNAALDMAQQNDKNFEEWKKTYPNVPANEAHQWLSNQLQQKLLTYNPNGQLDIMPPTQITPQDLVNGNPNDPTQPSLVNPQTLGNFNVDLSPISKDIEGVKTDVASDLHAVDNKGNKIRTKWSVPMTPFSQFVKNDNGVPVGSELAYTTVPGTDMKAATPEFMAAMVNSPAKQAAFAKMTNLAAKHYESVYGKPPSANMLPYLGMAALYQHASPLMQHEGKIEELTATPKTHITINNGSKAPTNINDVSSEIDHAFDYAPDGTERPHHTAGTATVPFIELPPASQGVVMNIVKDAGIKKDVGFGKEAPLDATDIYLKRINGQRYIMQRTENGKDDVLIAPLDAKDVNLNSRTGNTTAKQKQVVLGATPSATPTVIPNKWSKYLRQ